MNVTQRNQFDQIREAEYPATPQVFHFSGPATALAIIGVVGFCVTIMYLVTRNASTAGLGIVGTAVFFSIIFPIGVMASNGGIERWSIERDRQITIRRHHAIYAPYYVASGTPQTALGVEPLPSITALPTDTLQPVSAPSSYIPAIPPSNTNVRATAMGWVASLFDGQTGKPIKIKGASHNIQAKKPDEEVKKYLLGLEIIVADAGNNLFWNGDLYPAAPYAMQAIRTGVKRSNGDAGNGNSDAV